MAKWPSPQDYFEAIQDPDCINDPELRAGELQLIGTHQLPLVFSGQFAIVFKIKSGNRVWAARCFLHNFPDRTERYRKISEFILNDDLEHTVNFELIENGIRIADEFYPILKMEFVSGTSLGEYIRENCKNIEKLEQFQERFLEMMLQLKAHGIAHGDLQHDNIVITNEGRIRLIDYDGMFVPTLEGHNANELGHLNYQHPKRNAEFFNPMLDNFSAWLIKESVDLLIKDNDRISITPHGDCIFLNRTDFENPHRSQALFEFEKLSLEGKAFSMKIKYLLSLEPHSIPYLNHPLTPPADFSATSIFLKYLPEDLDGYDPTQQAIEPQGTTKPISRKFGPRTIDLPKSLERSSDQSYITEHFGYHVLSSQSSTTGEHVNKDAIKRLLANSLASEEFLFWCGGLAPGSLSTRYQNLKMNAGSITSGQLNGIMFALATIGWYCYQNAVTNWLYAIVSVCFLTYCGIYKNRSDSAIRHSLYTLTNKNFYLCFDGPREIRATDDYYHWDVYQCAIPLESIKSADFDLGDEMIDRVKLNVVLGGGQSFEGLTLWIHGLTEAEREKLYKAFSKAGVACRFKEKVEQITST